MQYIILPLEGGVAPRHPVVQRLIRPSFTGQQQNVNVGKGGLKLPASQIPVITRILK